MKCEHVEDLPGIWICPKCDHKAVTSHPPSRECGPGLVRKAANFGRSMIRAAADGFATLRPEQVAARLDVCTGGKSGCKCERYDADRNICVDPSCGCPMTWKPSLRAMACPMGKWPKLDAPEETTVIPFAVVPAQGGTRAYRGVNDIHPSDYNVTAIIPIVEPDQCLTLVIELLRLQTERPYILLVDTGSKPETLTWLETLRAADLEIHHVRTHGVSHASELVSMALDVGTALARTPYTFFTHADCFLTRQTALAELMQLAKTHVVAGHQITERPYVGWELEFGHTLLMTDRDKLKRLGISWDMRSGMQALGIADYGDQRLPPNYVDTERGFNHLLQQAGIPGFFTGTELNFQRNTDEWIDHVRSLSGSKLYSEAYQAKALSWLPDAVNAARQRIKEWSSDANNQRLV